MKQILVILCMLFICNIVKSQDCLTADLVIIMDWSGSEQGYESLLSNSANLFVSELPVEENKLRIGLVTFNYDIVDVVPITGNKDSLNKNIDYISSYQAKGATYIENSIITAGSMLYNDRKVPKIIIIISDGEIYDMQIALLQLKKLRQILPLTVFAVQIGGDLDDLNNLFILTGDPNLVERSVPDQLIEALKRLNMCI